MSAVDLAEARAACRDALEREMLFRSFSHDVAGAVMGTLGWVDLARMDGVELPPQVDKGLNRMNELVEQYRETLEAHGNNASGPVEPLLDLLGIPHTGHGGRAALDPLRLVSALELAAPQRVELNRSDDALRMTLHGLPEDAVRSAACPHFDTLQSWIRARDRRLGVGLLRVVTRSAGGEVYTVDHDALELVLPVA